jgi:hypothetical protein
MRSVGLDKEEVPGENIALLTERRDRIREWLAQQPEDTELDQKHLDDGSSERAYWHHGYQAALDDMLKLLRLWR